MAHLPSEVFNSSSVVTEPPSKQLPCVKWPIDACCTYKSRDLPLVHHTRSCFCCRQKVISWSASWFLQEVGRLLSDFGRLVGREKETGELLSAFVLSPSWSKNCSAFHRHTQIIWTRERLQRWEQLINTGDSYRTDFRERNIIPFENLCIKNAFLHQAGVNAGWKGRMPGIEERISPGGWRSPVYILWIGTAVWNGSQEKCKYSETCTAQNG